MENSENRFLSYFTKRNTFKLVVIELIIIGFLLCALLSMFVNVKVSLEGDQAITIQQGSVFVDPGATARADGREVEVTVTGKVNPDMPGTYVLCYKAQYMLSFGKAYRTVTVLPAE